MALQFLNDGYFAGKVGIGTESPGSKLTVDETSTATAALNIITARYGISLQGAGTSNTQYLLNLQSNGGSTDVMRVQSSGNVGIGTTSPGAMLDIHHTDTMIRLTDSDGTNQYAQFGHNNGDTTFVSRNNTSHGTYSFYTHDGTTFVERMSIQSNGNVGIGTTSPDTNLEIESSTGGVLRLTSSNTTVLTDESIGKIEFKSNDASTGGNNVMGFIDSVATNVGTRYALSFGTGDAAAAVERMRITNLGGISFGSTGTAYGSAGQVLTSAGNASPTWTTPTTGTVTGNGADGEITFWTSSSVIDGDSLFKWDASNNRLGVGVATPLDRLHVNVGTDQNIAFNSINSLARISSYNDAQTLSKPLQINGEDLRFLTGSTEKMRIDSGGNVGIGTTSPTAQLQVGGGTSNQQSSISSLSGSFQGLLSTLSLVNQTANLVTNGGVALDFHLNSGYSPTGRITTRTENVSSPTASYMQFFTYLSGLNERMRITSTGKVGIGTDDPLSKLHINDGTNVNLQIGNVGGELQIKTTNDADTAYSPMVLRASEYNILSGNVGIGTTSPLATLVIQPSLTSFNLAGLADGQIAVGNNAGSATAPTIGAKSTSTNRLPLQFITGQPDGSTVPGMTFSVREDNNSDFSTTVNKPAFDFSRYTTSLMRIDRDGDVGIGTASPSARLDVIGVGLSSLFRVSNTDADATTKYGTFMGRHYTNSEENITGMLLTSSSSVTGGAVSIGGGITSANAVNEIKFYTAANNTTLTGSERMRITSTGNVGIGTTSPFTKLHAEGVVTIKGSGTATSGSLAIQDSYGTTNHLGNIGWNRSAGGPYLAYGIKQDGSADWKSTFDNFSGMRSYMKLDNNEMQLAWAPAQQTTVDTVITGLLERFTFQLDSGTLKLNAYDSTNQTGTPTYLLGTDASGNVVKTNTVPGSGAGPYLPLAGGTMTGTNGVLMPDNFKLKFGDATTPDLEIYHDGGNSFINDTGAGALLLKSNGNGVYIKTIAGDTQAQFLNDGAVNLYYDNSFKFATTSTGVSVTGDVQIDSALLSNQENTDVDTGTETVASVAIATYTAAFFDFVIKKTTNVRSGTVYACHDGTNVEFTETSTQDLGDTSDVTLSVDISGGNMRLRATTTSDDWSVKSLIRAI